MVTEKEKRILKLLVKKYSRDILETSMDEYISSNGNSGTEVVDNIFIPLGYENFTSISIQYLKYALDFYDEIKNDDFSNEMERMMEYEITIPATEREIVFVDYSVRVKELPSLIEIIAKDVDENLFEYDPDRSVIDYGDSEVVDFDELTISSPRKLWNPTIIK